MEILSVKNLSFSYPNAEEKALDGISFSVNKGDFILICGASGCGKTTLLKQMKKELIPAGDKGGLVLYRNEAVKDMDMRTSSSKIGYVCQNPQNGIVTDKVWHELAFALENLGEPSVNIRKRVGEMATYFGISGWYKKSVNSLSGGQKQILNLASSMVLNPEILLLDEPTSQLDPIAASDFLNMVKRINQELQTTVIITEHRTEELLEFSTKTAVMEDGRLKAFDSPRNICKLINDSKFAMPAAVQIFNKLSAESCPLTIKEAKDCLSDEYKNDIKSLEIKEIHSSEPVLKAKNLFFRYEKQAEDVLCGTEISLNKGEHYALLGSNGSGKTTLLLSLAGALKSYRGKIKYSKSINISYLPQDAAQVFNKESVGEDYLFTQKLKNAPDELFENMLKELDVGKLLKKHPYDLSGGQLQKCAIGKILLCSPDIVLLDEPTKGLDAEAKDSIGEIILNLCQKGITVLTVTHDTDFAAKFAYRCGLMFCGEIIAEDIPQRFFGENNFYTTAASRISRHMFVNAVTIDDVVELCERNGRKK